MAYNYLDLTNHVLRRVNQVELTSSNFSSASGFQAMAKDSVNNALKYINREEFNWPFNHVEQDDTMVAGQVRYDFPSDAKFVDFRTFRVQRNDTFGNQTRTLREKDYEEYLEKWIDWEYDNTNTGIRGLPEYVIRAPDRQYIIIQPPDEAYTLTYDYFKIPDDLSASTDVPTVPEQFRDVIVDGAMYYVYLFRNDKEAASIQFQKFDEGINDLRKIYINRWTRARDTRIVRRSPYNNYASID